MHDYFSDPKFDPDQFLTAVNFPFKDHWAVNKFVNSPEVFVHMVRTFNCAFLGTEVTGITIKRGIFDTLRESGFTILRNRGSNWSRCLVLEEDGKKIYGVMYAEGGEVLVSHKRPAGLKEWDEGHKPLPLARQAVMEALKGKGWGAGGDMFKSTFRARPNRKEWDGNHYYSELEIKIATRPAKQVEVSAEPVNQYYNHHTPSMKPVFLPLAKIQDRVGEIVQLIVDHSAKMKEKLRGH